MGQRQAILDKFTGDDKIPVLLMSTGTGAFGYVRNNAPSLTNVR